MTKSEIIAELKQCKGNREALEFAVKFIDLYAQCQNCKHIMYEEFGSTCPGCERSQSYGLWEWGE